MKKLSVIGFAALALAAAAVGCSDDETDNPGKGGTTSDGGEPASTGGTPAAAGKTGSTGGKAGSTTTPEGGGGNQNVAGEQSEGGGGAGPVAFECTDVYAERPNGRKAIPHDSKGNITTDHLTNDTIWTLEGRWFVKPGETLTIDPCTLIEGSPKPNAGSLIVPQGAKIHAVGTKNAPIVFTSAEHKFDSGAPWGGIILVGKAPVARLNDTPKYTRTFEGFDDVRTQFGMADPADFDADDSSGEMQFVRIEFGGDIIVADKEINGLSLCGVGAGTALDHIMVKDQKDDCFEFFGGTVDANHLICQNSGDDMFDTDLGYQGHLQFLFGRNLADGTSTDPNGFEWDGDQDFLAAPEAELSKPTVSNVTLCGLGIAGMSTSNGAVLRRSIAPGTTILNAIFSGFDNGLDLRNNVGTNAEPFVSLTNSMFFGQLKADGQSATDDDTVPADPTVKTLAGDSGFIEDTYLGEAANNDVVGGDAPAGFDCYAEVPSGPSEAIEGGTPAAPLDKKATFIGAGDFAGDGWESGSWIEWISE